MSDPQAIGREPIERLAREVMNAVRNHYLSRPTDQRSPLEVLNALAWVAGVIIAGASNNGHEEEARVFFNSALNDQIISSTEQIREGQVR